MPHHQTTSPYRRLTALAGLGFASGLPNVLTQDTLKAWLSDTGVSVENIGLFSFVTFPYVFKFLWAPLLDRYAPPFLGRRTAWLLITQLGVALALLAMACSGPTSPSSSLSLLALSASLVVFFSATQDIAADAYRADILPTLQRGPGAASFITGYRIAMILTGSGALLLAHRLGWSTAYLLLAALMTTSTLITLFAPNPTHQIQPPTSLRQAVLMPLKDSLQSLGPSTTWVLAFVFLFRLPDILAGAMTMPLLIQKLGLTLDQIATARQIIGFLMTIAGAIAAGLLIPRLSLFSCLLLFGLLQAASNLGYCYLSLKGPHLPSFIAVMVIENFCAGLVGTGFVVYLMGLCNQKYSASQYALFSAITALPSLTISPLTGYVVNKTGYTTYFALTTLAAIPGLLLLFLIPLHNQSPRHDASFPDPL